MLARTAENLYWVGRYLERAESTARLLDITYHRLIEVSPAQEREAWTDVLAAVALEEDFHEFATEVTASSVSEFLVREPSNKGSLVAAISQARFNARGVREHLAMEFWESLNQLHLNLCARDLAYDLSSQPFELYAFVRHGIQSVIGVANETWSREEAWRFFTLGLLLERAEMNVRTLRVRHRRHLPGATQEWSATLSAASALQAYRRRYRTLDTASLVELLLMSPTLPRSVQFSLRRAELILEDLTESNTAQPSDARRLLGRTRSAIEFADPNQLVEEDLEASLLEIESQIRGVSVAVAREAFSYRAELDLHTLRVGPGLPVGHLEPSARGLGWHSGRSASEPMKSGTAEEDAR